MMDEYIEDTKKFMVKSGLLEIEAEDFFIIVQNIEFDEEYLHDVNQRYPQPISIKDLIALIQLRIV